MIGVIVGVVSSLLIFTFYQKDQKAVRAHKQSKIQQEKARQAEKKRQEQELQKLRNDPVMKKRRQDKQKQFQQTFMNKLDENDKKIISEYLQKNKKQGKTDQELVKQASAQSSLLMAFMFIVLITLIFAAFVLSGVELDQVKNGVLRFMGQFFPRIKQAQSSTVQNDL